MNKKMKKNKKESNMRKLIIPLLVFINSINLSAQTSTNVDLHIFEISRVNDEANFKVVKDGVIYFLKIKNIIGAVDSIYFYDDNYNCLFKSGIEILDTVELSVINFEGINSVLIETGGNILIRHVLILTKKVKLLQRVII